MGRYIRAAFFYRWNLLAFLGGLGFAAISGMPDIVIPLLMAGELSFLALLGTNAKFQKYVDAREAASLRQKKIISLNETFLRVLRSLPNESVQRFETLRARCAELRQIALDIERTGRGTRDESLAEVQLASLDRLLWIYLRLLFTEYSLRRFFHQTKREGIEEEARKIEQRIRSVESQSGSSQRERILETLRDSLETSRQRLANYDKASENYQLVNLELDRLENKIQSISETAVNRQDPNFISGQVDQVADSMLKTEETIKDLQFVTGFITEEDEVPEVVGRRTTIQSR